MLKFVMLVKLAFAMQRLTKHLKNFCHDQQRWGEAFFFILWGDTAVIRGGIELMETVIHCHLALD